MDYVIAYNEELFLSDVEMDEEFNRCVKGTQWSSDIKDAMRFVPEYASALVDDIAEALRLDPDMLGYFCATTDCACIREKNEEEEIDFDEDFEKSFFDAIKSC